MTSTALEDFLTKELVIWFDFDGTLGEREQVDCTRAQIAADIVSGEISDVAYVLGIEADIPPRNITEDIAREALEIFSSNATEWCDWQNVPAFIRTHLDDEVEDAKAEWVAVGRRECAALQADRLAHSAKLGLSHPIAAE